MKARGRRQLRFGEMVSSAGATRKARGWVAEESGVERYVGLEHLDSNSLKIRRWGSPDDVGANSDLRFFEPGDVILARRGIEQRKVGLAEFAGVASGHSLVFRAKPANVLPAYLAFFLQSNAFMGRADKFSVGSLSKTVNLSALLKEEFEVPDLAEQQHTVEILATCERAIERMEELCVAAEAMYKSALARMFDCAVGQEPPNGISRGFGQKTWRWRRVDEMFSLQLGKMSSKESREGNNQARYIKNNNVLWGTFSLEDLPRMSFDKREREKFSLKAGDLLVCEGGEIGRAAVWSGQQGDIYFQKALHRLRPHAEADTRFFMHYLKACSQNGVLSRVAAGGTILHLPQEKLAALRLPFPPLSEQQRCVSLLQEMQDGLTACRLRLQQLKSLKSAILEKEFAT